METRRDDLSIVTPDEAWTYGDLQRWSIRHAAELGAFGIRAGDRVVVSAEPGAQAVALLCALSMLGAVYVPISTDWPAQRVRAAVARIAPVLCVTGPGGPPRDVLANEHVCDLRVDGLRLSAAAPPHPPSLRVLESSLLYIMFTSGTTGTPKGIMMSHRACLVFWRALVHHCGLRPTDRVASVAPLSFDFSLIDIGLALGSGATLVLVPRTLLLHPLRLCDYLASAGATQLNCVPSLASLLVCHAAASLTSLQGLHTLFLAGESFAMEDARTVRRLRPALRIINCFGHTESMCCSFADVPHPIPDDWDSLAIGDGHPGAELLLVNERNEPVTEPGQQAELYLRAANLCDGYWQDAEATRMAFVHNPLNPGDPQPVFRTGDIAVRDARGALHYCHRRDLQVQLGGVRVELGEIEAVISSHPAVRQAIVTAEPRRGELVLVAWVTSKEAGLDPTALRDHCLAWLPAFMVPGAIEVLPDMPMDGNGKIDRMILAGRWSRGRG
jgi:amino acid adenylation domain-containing protein